MPLAGIGGRKFTAILLFSVVLLWTLSIPVSQAATAGGTSTPIKHVVVITMENHSFDNLFGKYPNNPAAANQSLISSITVPVNLLSGNIAGNLTAVANGSFNTGNPIEGYSAYHIDWNGGKMDSFLKGSGVNSLKYFTASQMGVEWVMAQQYAMGDNYFSSVLSETVPNRLFGLAGYSPVINDYGPPPYVPLNKTIFHELSSNGVSWSYYLNSTSRLQSPLSIIQGINEYSGNIKQWSSFYRELDNNTLPSVSWLMPIHGGGEKYSQHPSYSVLTGELWLLFTINRIMHSPEWNSTAIFINYDEAGGYYDNVPPPDIAGHQLGFRVPFIVISPYAKENYISSTVLSHTSILAFIDYNWKLPALNSLVASSNIPTDFFNFNTTYLNGWLERPPLAFSPGIVGLIPGTFDFSPSEYNYVNSTSSLFPMNFQIPLNEVKYNFTGSSNVTLSSLGSGLYSFRNTQFIPIYQNHAVIAIVLVAGAAGLYYYTERLLRKRK